MYYSDMMSTQLTDSAASCRWARMAKSVAPGLLAAVLLAALPGALKAEGHLAPSSELHQSIVEAQQTRDANRKEVVEFFATPQARKALKASNLDLRKVETAVSFLSDDELAKLALQSREMKRDLAAGALTNQQLTYIVIALVTAVIVILAT
jgi:hypothetical protein